MSNTVTAVKDTSRQQLRYVGLCMFGAGHVVPLPLRGLKNKHSCTWSFFAGRRRQMDGSADEKGKKRRKRGASGSVFVAPSVFIKTLLSPCERTGSRGGCLTQRRRRQPPETMLPSIKRHKKKTVKRIKSEMEIHSPFASLLQGRCSTQVQGSSAEAF